MIHLHTTQIKQYALSLGFHLVGVASVSAPTQDNALSHLQNWLASGYQAEMTWMNNSRRFDVRESLPEAQSVISLALNYYTDTKHPQEPEFAKISRYAWGRDYHKVMHKKLKSLSIWLETQGEGVKTRYYSDTGPIQDKVWAQRAGLGWISKNGNIITREYGSWVFLGEILTNLELEPDKPSTQHCGTCTRCLDACPTQAITQPFVIDANRCIAYHTIENRQETLPEEISSNLHGWVAGCDICQDVCPWNKRFAKSTNVLEFNPYPSNISPKLADLATITEEEWNHRFTGSAMRRIKPYMLRRNAQANLANHSNPNRI